MALETAGGVQEAPPPPVQRPVRSEAPDPQLPSTWANTPRNALCPCGSGKKYKHCHGRLG
jgi:preprotein translocase subunit SecA